MTEDFSRRFAAARRQIIEKEYANLNPEQREAVLTTEGPLLLLAGAGSGKTTVLIHRVANILQFGRGADTRELPPDADETMLAALEDAAAGRTDVTDDIRRLCAVDPAAPWQVLAITFTNKAADELKNRLEAKLGETGRDVWALTFHGTCVRILRRCADRIGFPNSFTIYDQADSLSVMKRILRDMNMDDKVFPPKAMLAAAGRYKGSLVSPEEAVAAEERSGDIRRIRTAKIYAAYAKHLQDAGAMDFDDLIYYTVRLLQDEPDVLAYYQKKFRYVLIDEYQDTNHLQYLFAALMASGSRNICVVGDDDQSIYKFRGATIENILSFEKQYPDARVIRLEQNYRSTGNILAAANAVIANNHERKGKTLWTAQSGGDPVTLFEARNEDDEADFVARTIASARRPMRDFAVLYRTNAQSRSIELALKRRSIPYRIFGGTRFFDRAEVKDILAYLSVIANPTDETRLLRIVNEPPRGIGATSLEKIREIAAAMRARGQKTILITRLSAEAAETAGEGLPLRYFPMGRVGIVGELPEPDGCGKIVVATGGTSDMPVAEEAALTAEALGNEVTRLYDVGVAGLHRLLAHTEEIMSARVIVAIAGMEGALASVIGGLADCPVIAVPTSVGYGANFGGLSALLCMLNSCASGVSVVNIDNGFGGGYLAHMINRLGETNI